MDSGRGLKSVKVEPPPPAQTIEPKQTCRLSRRHRVLAVGVFVGVALWFVHNRHGFAPKSWSEGRFELLGYEKSDSFGGKKAEELFL